MKQNMRLKLALFLGLMSLSFAFGAETDVLRAEKTTMRVAWNFLSVLDMKHVERDYSIDTFSGTLREYRSFELDSGLTLFAEYPLWRFSRQAELLGGVRYSFTQGARQMWLESSWGRLNFAPEHESLRPGDFAVQSAAVYLKPRWFTNRITPKTIAFYTASNISYNFITLSGDKAEHAKLDRAIGWGASLGAVFHDAVDVEFGFDMIYSSIINNSWRDAWSEFCTMYLAVGCRI
jgi:hypothetical protein